MFSYHHDILSCEGISLVDIASQIGTPCYVYSGGLIRARYAELSAAFHGYPHAFHYALKANSTLALLRLLRSLGAEADANSIGEIDVALRAGFIPSQIVFTGVGKTRDELERAVGLGLKAINAESAGELDRIDQIASAQGTRARVALRVNPDVDAQSHPQISTGLKGNKFGVPIGEAINHEVVKMNASGPIRDRLVLATYDPGTGTPDDYAAMIDRELAQWGAIVRDTGVQIKS